MKQRGFAIAVVMMLLGVIGALFAAYVAVTKTDISSTRFSRSSAQGFYAAEGGLNVRAETIRNTFVGYNVPSGTTPSDTDPCEGGNMGSGDFACQTYNLSDREVLSYVSADPSNPSTLTIPPGERYQYLNAQEYKYTAKSIAKHGANDDIEAMLELRFKSRLVPLFQFAAFYNKDLEILPGPAMTLSGPVHTNGDLYLFSDGNSLTITGQVTTAGKLFRGRKNNNTCNNSPVRIYDPVTARSLIPTCPTRTQVYSNNVTAWNGMIQIGVPVITIPEPEIFDPVAGQVYWDRADLRVVLNVDASNNPTGANPIQVVNSNYVMDPTGTAALKTAATCPVRAGETLSTTAAWSNTLYNGREGFRVTLLNIDLAALLDCLKRTNWFGTGKTLADATEGGLVFHFTVVGPNSSPPDANSDGVPDTSNRYGVRVYNGATLSSTQPGAPAIKGLTLISDQAMYVMGNFNSTNKKPAAVMADTINLLSNNWNRVDARTDVGGFQLSDSLTNCTLSQRTTSATTYNAAFLAATDSTGNIDGTGGQGGAYNGGLENYPRLHEQWNNTTLTYRGSFVSLNKPRKVRGGWGSQCYGAPVRDWNYDTSFNNAANLPPITPRFVYLRQELFVRDFER